MAARKTTTHVDLGSDQVDVRSVLESLDSMAEYIKGASESIGEFVKSAPSVPPAKAVRAQLAESLDEVVRRQQRISKVFAAGSMAHSTALPKLITPSVEELDLGKLIGEIDTNHIEQAAERYADALRASVRNRLVHLAEAGEVLERLGEPAEVAETWASLLPLAPSPLEEMTGPFYDTTGLRRWLGLTRQALDSRTKHGTLLALTTGSGQRVYPAWQWRSDASTIPHLAEVLQPLLAGARDPWTVALWMTAPIDHGDGREVPAWQWLDEGEDPIVVVSEAREDAARWAS